LFFGKRGLSIRDRLAGPHKKGCTHLYIIGIICSNFYLDDLKTAGGSSLSHDISQKD